MNDLVLQNRSLYKVLRNCQTDLVVCSLAYFKQKLYNGNVHTLGNHADCIFIFRPERAAWYLKVAVCYRKCEQPSRPFLMEKNDD